MPFGDVPDGRTDRRHRAGGGLHDRDRPGLVARGEKEEVRGREVRAEACRREPAVERDDLRETEARSLGLDRAAEGVLPGDVEDDRKAPVGQAPHRAEERRRVLHAVEVGGVKEAKGIALPRLDPGEEAGVVDAERHETRGDAASERLGGERAARGRHRRGAREREADLPLLAGNEVAPVADVGDPGQLASPERDDERKTGRGGERRRAAGGRPERVDDVERSVPEEERAEIAHAPCEREAGDAGEPERSEIEDARTRDLPRVRRRTVAEREDDELDAAPELRDQPEERGDDALGERAVDAARDDEGDPHRPSRRTIARP